MKNNKYIIVLPEEGLELRSFTLKIENELIDQAMERSNGVRADAARLLGIHRTTLVERFVARRVRPDRKARNRKTNNPHR